MISLRDFAKRERVTTRAVNNWMRAVEFSEPDFVRKNKSFGGYHNTELFLSEALCAKLKEEHKRAEIVKAEIERRKGDYVYTKKDICDLCRCSRQSVENFLSTTDCNQKNILKRPSRNGGDLYTEDFLKAFQAWLMYNHVNQGRGVEAVKEATAKAVATDMAISVITQSGNVEAMQCLMSHYVNETQAVAERKKLQEENAELKIDNCILSLENEELKHRAEYDRIINFTPWGALKKKWGIKDSFAHVCCKVGLAQGIDYVEKCMGLDVWPTKMVSAEAAERIINYYSR